jgi:DNA-binding NarL/FixJ family response regulator
MNAMPMRHVLIVGMGALLTVGVENLLAAEPDLQVSDITFTKEETFVQDVLRIRPDVILFHETGPLNQNRIFELLRAIPTTETLRVIILRSSNSTIDLYERRRVKAARGQDLLTLVRGRDL